MLRLRENALGGWIARCRAELSASGFVRYCEGKFGTVAGQFGLWRLSGIDIWVQDQDQGGRYGPW